MEQPHREEADELLERIEEARQRIANEVSDIDPEDLFSILHSLLRPVGTGKIFFLRRRLDGSHVF